MHFCVRKYFLQFFQKERSDNIFLYQSKNNDESFSYPAASKNEGLRGRSRCGRLSTAPKSAVGGRALFRKKRPPRPKRLSGRNAGPAFREAELRIRPEPGKPAQSACRRRACRSSPQFQQHDEPSNGPPAPERTLAKAGAAAAARGKADTQTAGRPAALRSRRPDDGQKKTGRSGKRSIPRMEKQWREAARRFGLA